MELGSKQQHSLSHTNWYAIYTKPRAEKKVFEQLCLAGFNAYLPLQTQIKEWSDRKKKIQSPLIPSFVFVNSTKENLFKTLTIKGAVRILNYLGKPAIIQDIEIANLKIVLQEMQEVYQFREIDFLEGSPVQVIKGPFSGLIAQAVCTQGRNRIVIKIESLGKALEINIPQSFLKSID